VGRQALHARTGRGHHGGVRSRPRLTLLSESGPRGGGDDAEGSPRTRREPGRRRARAGARGQDRDGDGEPEFRTLARRNAPGRVGEPYDFIPPDYDGGIWFLFRCCLTERSSLQRPSHRGRRRGTRARPRGRRCPMSPTTVSSGRSTAAGLRYGRLQTRKSRHQTLVRSLERARHTGGRYSFFYSIIEGFDRFQRGRPTRSPGLETPMTTRRRAPHRAGGPAALPVSRFRQRTGPQVAPLHHRWTSARFLGRRSLQIEGSEGLDLLRAGERAAACLRVRARLGGRL